jgi:hypothetical protein
LWALSACISIFSPSCAWLALAASRAVHGQPRQQKLKKRPTLTFHLVYKSFFHSFYFRRKEVDLGTNLIFLFYLASLLRYPK